MQTTLNAARKVRKSSNRQAGLLARFLFQTRTVDESASEDYSKIMPAKDAYHDAVRNALVKDGWTITHDPYTFTFGLRNLFVDLGAEWPVAAEKGGRKIAVEIKSFSGASEVHDLEVAVGQFALYREMIALKEPERKLYLAVSERAYASIFGEPIGELAVRKIGLSLIIFNPEKEAIEQWID